MKTKPKKQKVQVKKVKGWAVVIGTDYTFFKEEKYARRYCRWEYCPSDACIDQHVCKATLTYTITTPKRKR